MCFFLRWVSPGRLVDRVASESVLGVRRALDTEHFTYRLSR
jgi:hypothetical protein